MIPTNIIGPAGNPVSVGDEGEMSVVVHPHPPTGESIAPSPFAQFFTDTGDATGSSDMIVDGSVTEKEFSINAIGQEDLYIKTASVIIADNGARLNLFGALAELTNGVQVVHQTVDKGDRIIQDSITTNLRFIRFALGVPPIGDGTSAFRADISGGGADAYLPVIDFQSTFGLQWGLRLRAGTSDKITFKIRDNLAGLDQFDVIGYGITII